MQPGGSQQFRAPAAGPSQPASQPHPQQVCTIVACVSLTGLFRRRSVYRLLVQGYPPQPQAYQGVSALRLQPLDEITRLAASSGAVARPQQWAPGQLQHAQGAQALSSPQGVQGAPSQQQVQAMQQTGIDEATVKRRRLEAMPGSATPGGISTGAQMAAAQHLAAVAAGLRAQLPSGSSFTVPAHRTVSEDYSWVLPKRGVQTALKAAGLDKDFKIEVRKLDPRTNRSNSA